MVDYDDVTPLMLRVIPELGPAYLRFVDEWGRREGRSVAAPDIVMSKMVVPFLRTLLTGRPSSANQTLASRIFAFIEQLSVGENEAVQNLIEVSVCQVLIDDAQTHRKALPYMGPNTREWVEIAVDARRHGATLDPRMGPRPKA